MTANAQTLVIRHAPKSDPPQFTVERLGDGKASPPVAVPPPDSVPVEGRPDETLTGELRWYLETFLDYPFPPETDHAERILKAFQTWGKQTFTTLFTHPHARRCYEKAVEHGFPNLTLRVVSDSPVILGWPWEALYDPETDPLAHQCNIERRIDSVRDPAPLGTLPTDRVNVLLVIARPYERDVKYRSVSRPLVEMAEDQNLPVSIHVLRPPTLDQLRDHLRQHPNHYHILHFDGHGAYRPDAPAPGGNTLLRGWEGRLVFEKADGMPEPIEAPTLTTLLREHAVPAVVLNACQSAMVDDQADDPFASVAAALLKAGMRSVVAMAYSLYVSGAQQFLPAFYRRLFETGSLAEGVRAGRQQMLRTPGRVCSRGTYPLEDWVIPVVYQQDPLDFSFVTQAAAPAKAESRLPPEARDDRNPYGFVGRDGAVLALERALHRPPAGIVVTGLGGVGKTTLARGFLRWLEQTNGLGAGAVWFDFRDIRSAEYVLNRLGEAVFGKPEFATLDAAKKIELLAGVCKDRPLRIVWDNFESARGIPGTAVAANLSDADARVLKDFLAALRGGKTKVLITSRSPEDWLGVPTNIGRPVPLGGLDGEERWEFANAIVRDLGLTIDPKDPALSKLMDLLKGHPLAMRVVLAKLANTSAAQLTADLGTNFRQLLPTTGDESVAMLYATLRFATDALPMEWQPLLIPLGLHEGYADADSLEEMAKAVDDKITRPMIDACFAALETAGLVRERGQAIYDMHPLFTSYLRSGSDAQPQAERDQWARAFVDLFGSYADTLAPRPLHEQSGPFDVHGPNFHTALMEARRLGLSTDLRALTQSLAAYAQNTRNYADAEKLYEQLGQYHAETGYEKGQAAAFHQLGIVAQERRDLAAAEDWYRKALAISERQGDTHDAAGTYYQLGVVAQERRDLAAAEDWYRRALAISERQGNEHGAALTYGQLGTVALDKLDFAAAEDWYRKALAVFERQGGEYEAAGTYHQLGAVAQARRDLATAEDWYRKALAVKERLGDEHGAARTYHQLGVAAQTRRDLATAEDWYRKALAVFERLGDEHRAAGTYHQLGAVAEKLHDFPAAWNWYIKAVNLFDRLGDTQNSGIVTGSLVRSFRVATTDVRFRLTELGKQAGLSEEDLQQIEVFAAAPPEG